jgi:hypothetical protein
VERIVGRQVIELQRFNTQGTSIRSSGIAVPEDGTEMDVVSKADGEFLMADSAFKSKFDSLEICNKSPALYKAILN